MLLNKEPESIATIIVGGFMPEAPQDDYEMGKKECCEGMIAALKEGDADALKQHLEDFVSMVLEKSDENSGGE